MKKSHDIPLIKGVTLAPLYSDGKIPQGRERFTICVDGTSSLILAFRSHVGMQSSGHDDEDDFIIILLTILRHFSETTKLLDLWRGVDGTGRLSSLSFTISILAAKKRTKSLASCSGSLHDRRVLAVVEEHSLWTAQKSWRGSEASHRHHSANYIGDCIHYCVTYLKEEKNNIRIQLPLFLTIQF